MGGDDAREVAALVHHGEPRDAVLAHQVDCAPDRGVLVDGHHVRRVDVADDERVEAVEYGVEDGVLGDDAPQPVALEHRRDLHAALDEHPRGVPDVLRPTHLRRGPSERLRLRVVLDVGLEELLLRDDARVLAVLGDDDPLRVPLLEDGPDLPEALAGVDLGEIPRCDVGDIHLYLPRRLDPAVLKPRFGVRASVNWPPAERRLVIPDLGAALGEYTYLASEVFFGAVALALLVRADALRRAAVTIAVLYPVAYVWDWYTLAIGVFEIRLRTGVNLLGIPVEEHLFIVVVPALVLGVHETVHAHLGEEPATDAHGGSATGEDVADEGEAETRHGP